MRTQLKNHAFHPTRRQEETPYLDALVEHRDAVAACFNVPAHKAGKYAAPKLHAALGDRALGIDIPPMIPGIDSGAAPTALEKAQELAAEAWGAGRTWFIDHGGSGAVHAALLAARQLSPRILMQRNVHSSAIAGLVLAGLSPYFVQPEVDSELGVAHCVSRTTLAHALVAHPDAGAVFLVSPTYYGTAADIRGLIEEAHAVGKPVIIDEAWGAHFAFSDRLPQAATAAGADLVISSTHKMAGSLTQSAMLHLGSSPLAFQAHIVDRAVTALESTSPSALLAGSLDAARSWMATVGRDAVARTLDDALAIHKEIRGLGLDVLDRETIGSFAIQDIDLLRLCIDTRPRDLDARELGDAIRTRGVFPELIAHNVLVATLAPGEEYQHMLKLTEALDAAIGALRSTQARAASRRPPLPTPGAFVMTPRDAWFGSRERVEVRRSVGRVSADALAVYPPGIPNVIPGEAITEELVAFIEESLAAGAFVRGSTDRTLATVSVVKET